MLARRITTVDHYAAMTNALWCWEADEKGVMAWFEYAAMTGVARIASLLQSLAEDADLPQIEPSLFAQSRAAGLGSHTTRLGDMGPVFPSIISAMASESGAPPALIAALFGRLFVDVLATPAFADMFTSLPAHKSEPVVAEWAKIATAAWMVGWYSDLPEVGHDSLTLIAGRLAMGGVEQIQLELLLNGVATAMVVMVDDGHGTGRAVPQRIIDAPSDAMKLPIRVFPAVHKIIEDAVPDLSSNQLLSFDLAGLRDMEETAVVLKPIPAFSPVPAPSLVAVPTLPAPSASQSSGDGSVRINFAAAPSATAVRREGSILFAQDAFRRGAASQQRPIVGIEDGISA